MPARHHNYRTPGDRSRESSRTGSRRSSRLSPALVGRESLQLSPFATRRPSLNGCWVRRPHRRCTSAGNEDSIHGTRSGSLHRPRYSKCLRKRLQELSEFILLVWVFLNVATFSVGGPDVMAGYHGAVRTCRVNLRACPNVEHYEANGLPRCPTP
jgi:hypothetical protein